MFRVATAAPAGRASGDGLRARAATAIAPPAAAAAAAAPTAIAPPPAAVAAVAAPTATGTPAAAAAVAPRRTRRREIRGTPAAAAAVAVALGTTPRGTRDTTLEMLATGTALARCAAAAAAMKTPSARGAIVNSRCPLGSPGRVGWPEMRYRLGCG